MSNGTFDNIKRTEQTSNWAGEQAAANQMSRNLHESNPQMCYTQWHKYHHQWLFISIINSSLFSTWHKMGLISTQRWLQALWEKKLKNLQIQTIALTLVLGRCSAAISSAGAGTTDTCHVPSSGSSSAVVLEKQDGRNETTPTCWIPPHQTKSILMMPQCFWWDYCGLKWAIFIDKMWDCVHVLAKHGET